MRSALIAASLLILSACGESTCKENGVDCLKMPASQILAIDGDTYQFAGKRIRLAGWDSPETNQSAKCRREHDRGLQAEAQAKRLIGTGATATLQLLGEDQYQRAVARIWIDGTDIGQLLFRDGLSLPTEKDQPIGQIDWCGPVS